MNEPLQKLLEVRLPVRVSYELVKLSNALSAQLSMIDKMRISLVEKYGEKTEDGKIAVKQNSEAWANFVSEFNELMQKEEDIAFETKIQLPEKVTSICNKCKSITEVPFEIEPSILMALSKFIELP